MLQGQQEQEKSWEHMHVGSEVGGGVQVGFYFIINMSSKMI